VNKVAEYILECRDVRKQYGALAAVDGVTLNVSPGEAVGIGGPNGAGKTTFFDLISGLTAVSSGQVLFNGDPITGTSPHKLYYKGMARTFQVTDGFGSLTVYQNALSAVVNGSATERFGLFFKSTHSERCEEILERFKLVHLADMLVSDIPALDRKKLMVATAIAHGPKLLLLDEPVGGLAPAEVDEFIELMNELREGGLSIIFIEHVMRFLTIVADRALIMHQGKLIYDGKPDHLAADDTVRTVYLGSDTVSERKR
jgi:ABC-type branched-subunit amino acid transport system ATPase component